MQAGEVGGRISAKPWEGGEEKVTCGEAQSKGKEARISARLRRRQGEVSGNLKRPVPNPRVWEEEEIKTCTSGSPVREKNRVQVLQKGKFINLYPI
jgi:hypothetical protein